jgi:Phosphatidylinositolglycan class N (PIG-N)
MIQILLPGASVSPRTNFQPISHGSLIGSFCQILSIEAPSLTFLPSQVFKIIAPYIILSATFANLNARLHLPPFSLFLVALTLTDGAILIFPFSHNILICLFLSGMTLTFFFNVTDTGER